MIARLTRYQVDANRLDESIKAFKEKVIPAVKLQKGYRSGYLLADRATGKCVTIAFWESEKDLVADQQSGQYGKRVDTGRDRFVTPPVSEVYEVLVQD